jgi:hypothetical protein
MIAHLFAGPYLANANYYQVVKIITAADGRNHIVIYSLCLGQVNNSYKLNLQQWADLHLLDVRAKAFGLLLKVTGTIRIGLQ